jgi:hypothetical protein
LSTSFFKVLDTWLNRIIIVAYINFKQVRRCASREACRILIIWMALATEKVWLWIPSLPIKTSKNMGVRKSILARIPRKSDKSTNHAMEATRNHWVLAQNPATQINDGPCRRR